MKSLSFAGIRTAVLIAEGRINHDYLFFTDDGSPIPDVRHHRPLTMLTVYAAWTEGAPDHDIRAIRATRNPKGWKGLERTLLLNQ
jgi:hypothetical protein